MEAKTVEVLKSNLAVTNKEIDRLNDNCKEYSRTINEIEIKRSNLEKMVINLVEKAEAIEKDIPEA